MAGERVERRLAAILATDVAGYSRLMEADEEGTLARLKAHRRELIDPKIAERRGRIVKTTGDGMLVEFASVVDAVRCAAEIQRGMLDRENGRQSSLDPRFAHLARQTTGRSAAEDMMELSRTRAPLRQVSDPNRVTDPHTSQTPRVALGNGSNGAS